MFLIDQIHDLLKKKRKNFRNEGREIEMIQYYRDIRGCYSLDNKSMVSNETIVENRYLFEHFSVHLYQH